MNWLKTTLTTRIIMIEVRGTWSAARADWKNPDCHTLCIRTNMAAKKTKVVQSIFLIRVMRRGLNSKSGSAEIRAM